MSAARKMKRQLNSILQWMAKDPSSFVVHPGHDFTRNRILDFETMMRLLITFGGQTLRKEIFTAMKDELMEIPSASAFCQQRQKILPCAFYEAFRQFNNETADMDCGDEDWYGYIILAVDGTDANISYDPASDTFIENAGKSYNQFHINALYDITNRIYRDCLIEPKSKYNEARAAGEMMLRTKVRGRVLLLGDRNYASLNLFETLNRNNKEYVIRAQSNFIKEFESLPSEEFDKHLVIRIYTSMRDYQKALKRSEKNIHYLVGKSKFGKPKKNVTWDYQNGALIGFRIVRFQLSTGEWETLITNTNSAAFPLERLKHLYSMRWGIETSFRSLKYSIGMTNFHTRNEECIKQEIYAAMLMYNVTERIISGIVIEQREDCVYEYHVDFSTASYVIRDFFRTTKDPPGDLEKRLARYKTPYRPERHDKRKAVISKGVIYFMYRVA